MPKSIKLADACREKDIAKVKKLLKEKVNVNSKDNIGYTALHWAAIMRLYDIAELLLTHKANPDIKDRDGLTPVDNIFRYYGAMDRLDDLNDVKYCTIKPTCKKGKKNQKRFSKYIHEETIKLFQLFRKHNAIIFDVELVAQICKKYSIPKIIEILKKDGFKIASLRQRKANIKHIEDIIQELLFKNGYLLEKLDKSGPNEIDGDTYIIRDKKSRRVVKGLSRSEHGMNLYKLVNFVKKSIKVVKE